MAAAGQGVKATVEYVCNLLASLGAPLLSPEVLRQAKFNAPAAAEKLWPVLHSLVLLELMGFPNGDFGERLNDLWQNLDLEGQHDEIAAFVLYYLRLWGCPESALPAAESFEKVASRNLLIALAWLIAHTNVFSRGLKIQTARLQKTFPPNTPLPWPSYPGDTSACPETRNAARQAYVQASAHVARVKEAGLGGAGLEGGARADALVNQALTLYGRLRSELGSLAASEACQAKKKQELVHTQLEIRARTAEAAEAAGVKTPPALPLYGLYEVHLLRKRSALEAHEKTLKIDEAIHTAAVDCARHEALFWQWMESVVDERENGGRSAHSEPHPQDENTGCFPSQGELVSLASELDLRIEDLKRDHEGGVKAGGGEGGDGIAAQIEEMEAWLRSRGWESYDELFERVLEQAGPSGNDDVGSASFPDDIRALLEKCDSEGRGVLEQDAHCMPECPSVRPVPVYIPPVVKDERNMRGKAGTDDTGPTAPEEIDRLMKLALASARELARTRAENKRSMGRMLARLEEDAEVLIHGFNSQTRREREEVG